MNKFGKVYLAGAGPGDKSLVTLKVYELIKKCDVILFDKLANPELLKDVKETCELIFVGKSASNHILVQHEINQLLIDKAKSGKNVLRLKGGDPLMFGRGSEEALALREEDIEFEFVPGITAGIAATSYAGIPLTHRNLVTQTVFITAHESPEKTSNQVDWKRLAKMKNTNLVIYMGVSEMPKVADILLNNGMEKDAQVGIIRNATYPDQKTYTCTLSKLADTIHKQSISPPAIFIIGPTVGLRKELMWFEKRALYGKRIVATRAEDQAQSLYNLLDELGAKVIPFKVIKTEIKLIKNKIYDLMSTKSYDWIFFSSENGVRYFFKNLELQGLDARIFSETKVAVIGSSTAEHLRKYGIIADFVPSKFTSKALLEELPKKFNLNGKKVLRVKGDFNNDVLLEGLLNLGALTDTMEVYKILADSPDEDVLNDLKDNGADACMFTSMSTVNYFFDILGKDSAKKILNKSAVLSIGPVTSTALEDKKINNIIEAEVNTVQGLIDKLLAFFNK
jgi:uroporphyrinogen III methyltransferase/synthase